MITQQEVLDQLLNFARSDDNVRLVVFNGSRVNPNAPKDLFCDYDVCFVCRDYQHLLYDHSWIPDFGQIAIVQQNAIDEEKGSGDIIMTQFMNGVRLDLSFVPLDNLEVALNDSLTVVLLDKDGLLPPLPPPDERSYYPEKPSQKRYDEVTNEFWWVLAYVAKGIWRDELSYAQSMYQVVIEQLVTVTKWYIAARRGWQVNPGKQGKWFRRFLPDELWQQFPGIYASGDYADLWRALFSAGKLFRQIGMDVAKKLGYTYPLEDDQRVTEFIHRVQSLPPSASEL
ncbi:MAG: aminoglycoside 6-adenylyltransferase [Anaerolineales bacterium]|nr:aminoglycoside 6-adenylyltransferase [Anaerolineales bacterium]